MIIKPKLNYLLFSGAFMSNSAALFYQRYVFYNALGPSAFGLASMAIAPALFASTFLGMISGELVIKCFGQQETLYNQQDALKYILSFEVFGRLLLFCSIAIGTAILPFRHHETRQLVFFSLFLVVSSAFYQIALTWVLISNRKSLYRNALYMQSLIILLISKPLVDSIGVYSLIVGNCFRPLILLFFIVVGIGIRKTLRCVLSVIDASARSGRLVHQQAIHQIGGLILKTSWTTLDIMVVGRITGQEGAGQYRMLRTIALVPSVLLEPAWRWLLPQITDYIRRGLYKPLLQVIASATAIMSAPVLIMIFVPSTYYNWAYRSIFHDDVFTPHILKSFVVIWWLVKALSGWCRYLCVAANKLNVSTYANAIMCFTIFLLGPVLANSFGLNIFYVVPLSLLTICIYFWVFLLRFVYRGIARAELTRGSESEE